MLAALGDELSADDVQCAADVERLGGLERYRLRHVDSEQGRAERVRVTAEREAQRQSEAVCGGCRDHAHGLRGAPGRQRLHPARHA